ncbi:MAG TPA: hypothetical protein VJY65_10710 [Chloroflexota bacterium]|nr:hypothetical protein [Chloroflexota bacterium]
MATTIDATFYRIRLGSRAAARGERVICQLLSWAGADNNLARVRITHSTVPSYRTGMVGLVQRQRLLPVHPRRADAG